MRMSEVKEEEERIEECGYKGQERVGGMGGRRMEKKGEGKQMEEEETGKVAGLGN